jgi:hypothetical protein
VILIKYKFFTMEQEPPWAKASLLSRIHDHTHLNTSHSVELLWTRDQPVAETSTWKHTKLTRDRRPCPWRDSNPQSKQANGRRLTPYTARPSEPVSNITELVESGIIRRIENRSAQTPGTRSPWWLNLPQQRLIFLNPQCGSCFTLPFWRLLFWGGS